MLMLRQALHDADLLWTVGYVGWNPDSPAPHCAWEHVECTSLGRVSAM